jgi:hypothetical protein
MKRILGTLSGAAIAAALLLIGSGTAHAQNWPTTSPLRCNWTLTSGGTVTGGTSTISFSYDAFNNLDTTRTGHLTTTYPNGSSTVKAFTLIWDWNATHADTFIFEQTTDTPNIICYSTRTFDAGTSVIFDRCSNGAYQSCRP